MQVQILIKTVFFDNGLKVKWVWFRIEYQLRGTAHAHGCLHLINDPGLIELASDVMKGRIAHRKLYGQASARHGFSFADIKMMYGRIIYQAVVLQIYPKKKK